MAKKKTNLNPTETEAELEGYEDARDGKWRVQNPYSFTLRNKLNRAWLRGWKSYHGIKSEEE